MNKRFLSISAGLILSLQMPLQAFALTRDVPFDHPYADAIAYFEQNGVIQGYPDGTYQPEKPVNRAELMKIIAKVTFDPAAINACAPSTLPFRDVLKNGWYAKYICLGYKYGYLQGYADGTFRPDAAISFVEAAKIISLSYNLPSLEIGGTWFKAYVETLSERKAIPVTIGAPGDFLTRGELAEILYRIDAGITDRSSLTYALLMNAQTGGTSSSGGGTSVSVDDDFSITITADDRTPEEGDSVEYKIVVRNNSGEDQDIDVRVQYDRDFSFESATGGSRRETTGEVEWRSLTIDDGESETLRLELQVRSGTDDDEPLEVRVNLEDEDGEEYAKSLVLNDDDSDDEDDEDEELSVRIEADDETVETGDTVEFEIEVENRSGDDERVDVRVQFDSDLEFVSADEDGEEIGSTRVDWENVDVDDDDTVTLTLKLRLKSTARDGDELKVTATAEDTSNNDDEDTIEVTVDDDDDDNDDDDLDDDLSIRVETDQERPEQGTIVEYEITLRNNTSEDQDIDLDADFDADLTFVSASDDGDLDSTGRKVTWNNIEVDEGDSEIVTLRLKVRTDVSDGTELEARFSAEDEDGNDADDSIEVEVVNENDDDEDGDDVSVQITADDDRLEPGDTATFIVEVRNLGIQDDVFLVEARFDDDEWSFVSASDNGTKKTSELVEWKTLAIDAQQTELITLKLKVRSDMEDGDRLTVRVRGENSDDDADTAEEEVRVDD